MFVESACQQQFDMRARVCATSGRLSAVKAADYTVTHRKLLLSGHVTRHMVRAGGGHRYQIRPAVGISNCITGDVEIHIGLPQKFGERKNADS